MKRAIRGKYKIIRNEEISPGIFELLLSAPEISEAAEAGQFVNIYLPGGEMLLPRPLSIADAADDNLTVVYAVVGKGTQSLSAQKHGDYLEIMGPLGTGFFDNNDGHEGHDGQDKKDKTVLLIGGGVGIPPLYFAAKKLRTRFQEKTRIIATLGFREAPWYQKEFESVCDEVYVTSETEGAAAYTGNVIGLLDRLASDGKKEEDIYNGDSTDIHKNAGILALACGPRPMLKAAAEWCAKRGIPLRVSLEERMGCGYGACAGCTVKIKIQGNEDSERIIKRKVCTDGPVFWADEVVW